MSAPAPAPAAVAAAPISVAPAEKKGGFPQWATILLTIIGIILILCFVSYAAGSGGNPFALIAMLALLSQ